MDAASARPIVGTQRDAWVPAALALLALLAIASLAQGMGEVTLPLVTGKTPFALTFALARELGAAGLYAAILFHNLGLLVVLPAFGLAAAGLERRADQRRLIGPILLFAVAGAIAAGVLLLVRHAPPEQLPFTLLLAAAEGGAILGAGLATHREMRALVGRADVGALGRALRGAFPALLAAAAVLAALALLETWHLLG